MFLHTVVRSGLDLRPLAAVWIKLYITEVRRDCKVSCVQNGREGCHGCHGFSQVHHL